MQSPKQPVTGLSPLKQVLLAIDELQVRLAEKERAANEPIAIVGIGCRFPGDVASPESFWELLRGGGDAITEIPAERWPADTFYDPDPDKPGRMSARSGGFLRGLDQFDPETFGISPREAAGMDPQQRLLLEVAWEALENAGESPANLTRTRTGVFIGIVGDEFAGLYRQARDLEKYDAYFASGIARSVAAGRISYVFGLEGPSLSVDTACSSSLVAVHLACQSLRAGECGMALAGGVNVLLTPELWVAFSRAHMLSPDGRCKPFDAAASGFARAEGCGIVVLKRLSEAQQNGDRILAVIRGSSINQDGKTSGLTVPSGPSQEAVLRDALARAGLHPHEVSYIEAHGSGTSLGDPIEAHALREVYGKGRSVGNPVYISAAKSNIGHTEAACGIAGLIKAVLAIQNGEIPGNVHFHNLNPHIQLSGTPLVFPPTTVRWPGVQVRRAGVSAFGFSGTNVHVILEQAQESAPTAPGTSEATNDANPPDKDRPLHILALSARTEAALRVTARRFSARLHTDTDTSLPDVAFSANVGRSHLSCRLAVIAEDRAQAHEKLEAFCRGEEVNGVASHVLDSRERPRVAFLFSGQGAQFPGMGRALYETHAVFASALNRCDAELRTQLERPLLDVMFGNDKTLLDRTVFTQPALFAIEYALAELWKSWGIEPYAVLGHSVGEYAAACIAGLIDFEDALRLVAERGRLMDRLPAGGAMAVIFAAPAAVASSLQGRPLAIAGINGPLNTVISGDETALDAVLSEFAARNFRVQRLAVSHAFHSHHMEPMAPHFASIAAAVPFRQGKSLLISSVTGQPVAVRDLTTEEYWWKQVREPVLFHPAMGTLASKGCQVYLELGPSTTLLGMAQQCVDGKFVWLPSLRRGRDDWQQITDTLSTLYLNGAPVDWRAFDAPYRRRKIALPTYPFERRRLWNAPEVRTAFEDSHPGTERGHELIGTELQSPALRATVFEARLSRSVPAFLADHVVFNVTVAPMTAYAAMAFEAARQSGRTSNAVETIFLKQPMAIPETGSTRVQVILDSNHCEILSLGTNGWISHATACLAQRQIDQSAESLDELKRRISVPLDRAAIYSGLQRRGICHGAMFLALEEVWVHDKEALGRLRIPEAVPNVQEYLAHPVLLDAAAQLLGAVIKTDEQAFLPLTTERIVITQPLGAEVWAHACLQPTSSAEVLSADIAIFDCSERRVAEISGLTLKRADRASLARGLHISIAPDWVYEFCWQPDSPPEDSAGEQRLAVLARHFEATALQYGREGGLQRYEHFLPRLDHEIVGAIVRALRELRFTFVPGRRFTVVELADELQIAPSRRRWFERLLGILTTASILRVCDAGLEVIAEPGHHPAAFDALQKQFPEFSPELHLTASCAPQFAEVLRGNCDPLHILFPEGSFEAAEALYRRSVSSQVYNRLVAEAVAQILRAAGPGVRHRILEIGGGTGGTTDAIVKCLPQESVEYVFTDISPLLVARARERFSGHRACQFQTFDVEREPASQGLRQSFDIVIAANVLHATADLRSTLTRVHKLMAPRGVLLMLEVNKPQLWIDATFGMTDGWWKFTDSDLRPHYPTLGEAQWQELLGERGLDSQVISAGSGSMQTFIIAGGNRVTTAAGQWLIVADSGGVADRVAQGLEQKGASCTLVRSDAALTGALEQIRSWRGLVLLSALDANEGSDVAPLDWQQLLCGSLLSVVQRLTRAAVDKPPELFIVTREAHAVQAEDRVRGLAQSSLWGFARTIALEHPELPCKCIDIDTVGNAHEAILAELLRRDGTAQVTLRDGRRYVPRLARWSPEDVQAHPQTLVSRTPGSLDSLAFENMYRRSPEQGEIEIQVELTALNFRDVLSALGTYAGNAAPLGSECGGRIVSIGPGVSGFAVGQQVVTVAGGAARSFVTADARLTCPVPPGMTLEEAVTLPMAFLTASYALEKLAAISTGERVLIHAAAGGVGLAAVQIAQKAGAEVFATAGSERKRAYLRSLGIRYVFDSRSTEFSQAVLKATGGEGIDLVLNSLTGEMIGASFSVLRQGGRFVELGRSAIWDAEQVRALGRGIQYCIVDGDALMSTSTEMISALLQDLMSRAAAGHITPLPYRVFPFHSSQVAFRFMAQARHIGKLLLRHPASQLSIDPAGAYVITGGLGALGLHAAEWLVGLGAKNLVLIGRNEPSEAARQIIAAVAQAGVRVLVRQVDVSLVAALAACLTEIRCTIGPLRGVIHAAGSLSDGVLAQQTWPRFSQVLPAKVGGAWNLHSLTESDALQFFVLFSSVAGPLGAPGQSNHASASTFLDALAAYRRNRGLCALSIDWGPWAGRSSADRIELMQQRREVGISDIPVQEAITLVERGIMANVERLIALPVVWKQLVARRPACAPLVQHLIAEVTNTPATPPQLVEERWFATWCAAPATRRGPLLEQQLQRLAAHILGIEADTRIDRGQALHELGLDSLMAVELRNAIAKAVEQPLVATLLFSYPTIESLVKYLLDLVFASHTLPEAVSEPSSQLAGLDMLEQIERLSDEEVEQLYTGRTGSKQ